MKGIVVVAAWLLTTLAVQAAPVIYGCDVYSRPDFPLDIAEFDQIVVDAEAETVELRVGRTLGTADPRTKIIFGPETANPKIFLHEDGDTSFAAVSHLSVASFTMLGDYTATYSFITGTSGFHVTWFCRK